MFIIVFICYICFLIIIIRHGVYFQVLSFTWLPTKTMGVDDGDDDDDNNNNYDKIIMIK